MTTKAKISHEVLNAKYHEREAEIVAQAGRLNNTAVANMAGRGTDIKLGGDPDALAIKLLQEEQMSIMKLAIMKKNVKK